MAMPRAAPLMLERPDEGRTAFCVARGRPARPVLPGCPPRPRRPAADRSGGRSRPGAVRSARRRRRQWSVYLVESGVETVTRPVRADGTARENWRSLGQGFQVPLAQSQAVRPLPARRFSRRGGAPAGNSVSVCIVVMQSERLLVSSDARRLAKGAPPLPGLDDPTVLRCLLDR